MSKRNLIFPHYPNLVLKRLTQDTTVAELIETFNYNFEQIYLHKGIKGEKGDTYIDMYKHNIDLIVENLK